MRELVCAVCHASDYRVRYSERIPAASELNFSARRNPQKHHARIVQCRACGLVYSNPYFDDEVLRMLYREASYIDEQQLENMSDDYVREFVSAAPALDHSAQVLEIGCGNGFFLDKLYRTGFTNVCGVEPGKDAAQKAPPTIRDRIWNEFFEPSFFRAEWFDVRCCFQIFDHLPDPNQFLRDMIFFSCIHTQSGSLLAL